MREFGREKRYDNRQGSRRPDSGSDRSSGGRSSGGSNRRGSGGFSSGRSSGGFNRGRSSGGFGRGRSSGGFGGRRDEVTMHKVKCDDCGEMCEVPFKPTASKPVYCNDCFKNKGKGSTSNQCNCKDELEKINQKIDLILEVVKGLKTMQDSAKVEEKTEKKSKTEKVAAKTTKKKTVKKKTTKK